MIKYLGSKRALLPRILELARGLEGLRGVGDLFSGTSRVGHAFKRAGCRVVANDHNAYAAAFARCYVQADAERWLAPATELVAALAAHAEREAFRGYFTRTFCEEARYLRPENGRRVDAARARIRELVAGGLDPELEAVLLTSLVEAADRVDSTTGVQMAYLKQWAPRTSRALELRVPELLPRAAAGPGLALELDAEEAAARAVAERVDLVYLDPPYNQHKYVGNYHVWETLVRGDEPATFGVANKRVDCRERRSPFNSRGGCAPALAAVVAAATAGGRRWTRRSRTAGPRYLMLSFNDEGHVARGELEALLAPLGRLTVHSIERPRYVGARIGIHSPKGVRVGEVGRLRNVEHLFIVDRAG